MLNVFEVSDALVNHIRTHFSDDIAIIACYGSYAQGTATKRSDLDFFFIPATPHGYRASIQFIVNDISFDFWPISWERAEKMALMEDSKTTIIADSRILYVRSDEDHARFMKLREKINDMQDPKNGQHLTERAEALLHDVYVHLYKMRRNEESDSLSLFRIEAYEILTKVLECLALLNQTFYTKGWGKNMDQIMRLPLKPARLEMLIDAIMTAKVASKVRQACEELVSDTLELVLNKKETYTTSPSYPDRMLGYYEEVKGGLDKVVTACEINDYSTAFYGAIGVQDQIAHFLYFAEKGNWPSPLDHTMVYLDLYKELGFPNLINLLNPDDLTPLQTAIENLDNLLESHLKNHEVKVNRFPSLEEFKAFLNNKTDQLI
ncbi:MAG: kanamycin nucleotidyltransferase C-terminal domain-containing protein [Bacillota bacterium]